MKDQLMSEPYLTDEQVTDLWVSLQLYKYNLSDDELMSVQQSILGGCRWAIASVMDEKQQENKRDIIENKGNF